MGLRWHVAIAGRWRVCAAVAAVAIGCRPAPAAEPGGRWAREPRRGRPSPAIATPQVALRVGSGGPGLRIPSGFLGFSFESKACAPTGSDRPGRPGVVELIRNLTPGRRR